MSAVILRLRRLRSSLYKTKKNVRNDNETEKPNNLPLARNTDEAKFWTTRIQVSVNLADVSENEKTLMPRTCEEIPSAILLLNQSGQCGCGSGLEMKAHTKIKCNKKFPISLT